MYVETKFLDTAWNGVTMAQSTDGSGGELNPSTGCTNSISVPAQGDGEQERDGRKYVLLGAFFSGNIGTASRADQADVDDAQGYYFALVLDTQTNGGTATGIDSESVFINPSTTTTAMLPQPLRNLSNSKRYRILDSCFVPPGGAYAATDGTNTASLSVQSSPTVKLGWKGRIVCDSLAVTTANVTAAADNSLHIVCFAGSTNFTPAFSGKCRVRFQG